MQINSLAMPDMQFCSHPNAITLLAPSPFSAGGFSSNLNHHMQTVQQKLKSFGLDLLSKDTWKFKETSGQSWSRQNVGVGYKYCDTSCFMKSSEISSPGSGFNICPN